MGSIRSQLNTPELNYLKALHTPVLQGFFNGVTDAAGSSHQAVEHRQFRQFIPPLLGPEGLTALIHLHQLLHGALVEQLMEVYERSQALWAQEWRHELSELPMLNRLVA